MRRFDGIELASDQIPDETTIPTFRHLLDKDGARLLFSQPLLLHRHQRNPALRMPFKCTGQIDQGEWVEPACKITGKAVEAAVGIGDVYLTTARVRHIR